MAAKDFLAGECKLPTFTTVRPSDRPLRKPANLSGRREHEKERWRQDRHRFPPYQCKDINCVVDSQGSHRLPKVEEREVIMGFPVGYTAQSCKKSEYGPVGHDDTRVSLVGNSWHVGVVAWLLGSLLRRFGVCSQMDLSGIVEAFTPGRSQRFAGS